MQRNFGNHFCCNRCDVSRLGVPSYDPLESLHENGEHMDRRRERRLNLELPVRIWGVDRMGRPFAEIVRIRNVSNGGAVLAKVRSKVQTGDALDVQLGASRSQFRIVWMGPAGEAGIQALEMEAPIFGMDLGRDLGRDMEADMGMGPSIGLPKFFDMVGTG